MRYPARIALSFGLISLPFLSLSAAPRAPQLFSKTLLYADWGIQNLTEVRLGQLGLIYARGGTKLQIYKLRKTLPKIPSVRIRSRVPSHKGSCFVLSHFGMGNTNRLGGYFNAFQRAPSQAQVALLLGPDRRRALSITYQRAKTGFCGAWVHLFNFKAPPSQKIYLNAKPYRVFRLWVRGRRGGEQLRLKVADVAWEKKGDALPVGMLHAFLPSGRISRKWQQAKIPLSMFPKRIRRDQLASLVFEATAGSGQVDIKTVAFCKDATTPLPLPPPSASHPQPTQRHLATWLWKTKQLFQHPQKQIETARFLKKYGFTHIFLQLPNRPKDLKKPWPKTLQKQKWRKLLQILHAYGLKAHALEGFKEYALPKWHPRVLETMRQILAYNQAVSPQERFDGVRYDIEPYLLDAFRGARRDWVMTHYLNLLKQLTALAHQGKMVFGVDIPFWFDERSGPADAQVGLHYHGIRKPLYQHVIDVVDNVGIMDYRTQAYGADGIIAHVTQELRYASQQNKRVYVGLETLPLPDEALLNFQGPPTPGWPKDTNARYYAFFFESSAPQPGATLHLVSRADLHAWKARYSAQLKDPSRLMHWPIHRVIFVPSSKISFAYLGHHALKVALHLSEQELLPYRAFAGFALHSYASYRTLLQRRR